MDDVIVVVDVQVDYCLPEGQLGMMGRDMKPTVALVESLKIFLSKARMLGVPIIIVRSETDTLCRRGSRGADLCIQTEPSDILVTKRTYGAFHSSGFRRTMKKLAPKRMVVTGVDTHLCVETTVRQAFDLHYSVCVVSDLVATRGENRELHEASLRVMGKYFAELGTSESLLKSWTTNMRPSGQRA